MAWECGNEHSLAQSFLSKKWFQAITGLNGVLTLCLDQLSKRIYSEWKIYS